MHFPGPLILGAGPAGCAAAIALEQGGTRALLIDRDETVGDALCGGFLSWKTAEQLRNFGLDPADLGAHLVSELRLFAGGRSASASLPAPSFGLSRHALDSALRAKAIEAGVQFEIDTIRGIEGLTAQGTGRDWSGEALFLASGKHDVRGHSRPRDSADPALGLRLRLPASPELTALLAGAIELHLFAGGYAGIVLQEDGSANICLAVKKSLLAKAGGNAADMLEMLATSAPHFAARLTGNWRSATIDTIGAVPYGWIAQSTQNGLFRLGDQAAVIPSLAGEGMSIALASGILAARYWDTRGAPSAQAFQSEFARHAARPVRSARMARALAETRTGHRLALAITHHMPSMIGHLMERTRIPDTPHRTASLAQAASTS